jgi:hypothetical protein
MPLQIASIESLISGSCSSFEFHNNSTSGTSFFIIDPSTHPINEYLNFNSVESSQAQTIYYEKFSSTLWALEGSTLEVYGDGLLRFANGTNEISKNALDILPIYGKFVFGHSRKIYPDGVLGTSCAFENQFISLDPSSPNNVNYNGNTVTKIWYPTSWPVFDVNTSQLSTISIKTKKNICLGIYSPPGELIKTNGDGRFFNGTGWFPYSVDSTYGYTITGTNTFNYIGNSNKTINYNNIYFYFIDTANKLRCSGGIVF